MVVVFPASMCAMIPMFRICAMGNDRATTSELPFRRSADSVPCRLIRRTEPSGPSLCC